MFFISVPINKPEELEQDRQNNDMIKNVVPKCFFTLVCSQLIVGNPFFIHVNPTEALTLWLRTSTAQLSAWSPIILRKLSPFDSV